MMFVYLYYVVNPLPIISRSRFIKSKYNKCIEVSCTMPTSCETKHLRARSNTVRTSVRRENTPRSGCRWEPTEIESIRTVRPGIKCFRCKVPYKH